MTWVLAIDVSLAARCLEDMFRDLHGRFLSPEQYTPRPTEIRACTTPTLWTYLNYTATVQNRSEPNP